MPQIDLAGFTITDKRGEPVSWFSDEGFALLSHWWLMASWQRKYSYQFNWFGRPIIQLPSDILMMQDLLHRIRPTVIIETGIAHGGSVVFHASMLQLLHRRAYPAEGRPHVYAIDIDIKPHNRDALECHELRDLFTLLPGDSTDPDIILELNRQLTPADVVLVALDSDHRRDHVARELAAYAPLVTPGSAIVVMDGIMPDFALLPNGRRHWLDDSPASAIDEFMHSELGRSFEMDTTYDGYAITHSPRGILLRHEA